MCSITSYSNHSSHKHILPNPSLSPPQYLPSQVGKCEAFFSSHSLSLSSFQTHKEIHPHTPFPVCYFLIFFHLFQEMQDTQTIACGGRLFAGGSGGGDRRLRPQQSHNHQQALKCPRCDSLNTKFCYYNNYNLSQPRHFCKSCRRYWTKGGVLRNVPVGGGCRKTKRSKTKPAAVSSSEAPQEQNSNSHSSSESSSLTATTTAAKKTPTAGSSGEVGSATVTSASSAGNLLNFTDSRFILAQMNGGNSNSFDQSQPLIDPIGTSEGQIFSEVGSFTSLMASSNDPGMLNFTSSMTDISGYGLQQSGQGSAVDDQSRNQLLGGGELKMEQISCGFLDQTAHIGFPGLQPSRTSNGGLSGLDWQMNSGDVGGDGGGGGGDQELFDFTGTVDQTYWGQNHWADHDQSLNFPPLV